ncbi:hypothetical protein H9P43_004227 [Blastocladiella emersonii ATCC 22665]|nr:hypothetical protein H9P43_004227 [Blastocladiella emersonii ATCC 22665]
MGAPAKPRTAEPTSATPIAGAGGPTYVSATVTGAASLPASSSNLRSAGRSSAITPGSSTSPHSPVPSSPSRAPTRDWAADDTRQLLPVVPLFGARILFPGIVLRLALRDDGAVPEEGSLVACVPVTHIPGPGAPSEAETKSTAVVTRRAFSPSSTQQSQQSGTAAAAATNQGGPAVRADQLAEFGCLGRVVKAKRSFLGPMRGAVLLVQGLTRLRIDELIPRDRQLLAATAALEDSDLPEDQEHESLATALRRQAAELVAYTATTMAADVARELRRLVESSTVAQLTYVLVGLSNLSQADRVAMLSLDTADRLARLVPALQRQLDVLTLSDKIRTQVGDDLAKKQRELILRQQLEAIKRELGDDPAQVDEVQALRQKLEGGSYPDAVVTQVARDLKRLQGMSSNMAEYHTLLNYCETALALPWTTATEDRLDLAAAQRQLDADHQGLDKVKQRIIEYLAVRKLRDSLKGPILCLYGPPGVGKTSIAKSIADSMGRKFERIALGGVRDESEIRGHRRTYVGAMPGVIAQALRRCGSRNPVILLDEVDKLGRDPMRGDPSGALLELLDPEQNAHFVDHYVQVPLDLSQVLFIATANSLDSIQRPLLDRMEVLELHGYAPAEKRAIARAKLVPKQLAQHGLASDAVHVPDAVLDSLITQYTREAGVRGLERAIAALCRTVAVEYVTAQEKPSAGSAGAAMGVTSPRTLTPADVAATLGPAKYERDAGVRTMVPGLVQGLAWTGMGTGAVLVVEASVYPGKGAVQLTGQLGSVLKESAQLAMTWLRAHAHALGLVHSPSDLLWATRDVHIHLPAGAVPKDGPSAGVALATALTSLAMGCPVRPALAMTGEITLRGDVLPVGGIKEKALAAHAAGVRTLVLPAKNGKDVAEIPADVRADLEIVLCDHLAQVLRAALDSPATLTLDARPATNGGGAGAEGGAPGGARITSKL